MKKRKGVWIDSRKAIIIDMRKDSHDFKTIEADFETRERIEGETRQSSHFGNQHISTETKKKQRLRKYRARYLKSVAENLSDSEVFIFGPAEAKNELAGIVRENTNLHADVLDVRAADSMTDNQVIAEVRSFFDN